MLLKVGTTTCGVHINRVHPLLTEDKCDHTVLSSWTPLFHQEEGVTAPTSTDQVEQQIDPQTDREDPQEQDVAPFPPPAPTTTRSGCMVKPVQRYGWT